MVNHIVKRTKYFKKNALTKIKLKALSAFAYQFDKDYKNKVDTVVKTYCEHHEVNDEKRLRKAFIKENIENGFLTDAFIGCALYEKSDAERKEYLSDRVFSELYSKGKLNTLPRDKYERYLIFKNTFKRDVIKIDFDFSVEEEMRYADFISKHGEFIAKPLKGTKGKGVEKLSKEDFSDLQSLKAECETAVMLEELIIQGEEMASFNPSSVNSCRFVSVINKENKCDILFSTIRTGRAGSVVDNVGAGGITALIDNETGIVSTDGVCGFDYFEKHPDTGMAFKGFQVPDWEKLKELAFKAHSERPQQKLLGWDFAWTDKGFWDVIEVNPAPAFVSYQKLTGKGIIPLLKEKGLYAD